MARTKKRLRSADSAAEAAASVVENVGCVVNFADHSLPHPPPRKLRTVRVHQGEEKFMIPEPHRHFVIMKIRQLWNTWKSRTTKFLKETVECGETEDYIDSKAKPREVSDQEWTIFRRQRSFPQFIEKSKWFQELRAKQKLPYTLGRKGYARLEEEMN